MVGLNLLWVRLCTALVVVLGFGCVLSFVGRGWWLAVLGFVYLVGGCVFVCWFGYFWLVGV